MKPAVGGFADSIKKINKRRGKPWRSSRSSLPTQTHINSMPRNWTEKCAAFVNTSCAKSPTLSKATSNSPLIPEKIRQQIAMPYKSITCKAYGIQKLPHEFSYETFFGNYCNFFKILPFLNMFFQQQPSKIIRRNFCLKNTETLGKFCLFAVVPTWERPVFCDPCAIHLLQ